MTAIRSPLSRHSATPAELREQLAADREGQPYLLYRHGDGSQRIFALRADHTPVTVGRGPECDVCLAWDTEVSGLHATLERLGGHWTVADANLSRNGTFLNGERVHGRARLRGGDILRCGVTEIGFRAPALAIMETAPPSSRGQEIELTPAQRRVLVALCRPYEPGSAFPRPATNREIADALVLSLPAVKSHLRTLFDRFGVEDLPHNQKRARLVELALSSGAVAPHELSPRRAL